MKQNNSVVINGNFTANGNTIIASSESYITVQNPSGNQPELNRLIDKFQRTYSEEKIKFPDLAICEEIVIETIEQCRVLDKDTQENHFFQSGLKLIIEKVIFISSALADIWQAIEPMLPPIMTVFFDTLK